MCFLSFCSRNKLPAPLFIFRFWLVPSRFISTLVILLLQEGFLYNVGSLKGIKHVILLSQVFLSWKLWTDTLQVIYAGQMLLFNKAAVVRLWRFERHSSSDERLFKKIGWARWIETDGFRTSLHHYQGRCVARHSGWRTRLLFWWGAAIVLLWCFWCLILC